LKEGRRKEKKKQEKYKRINERNNTERQRRQEKREKKTVDEKRKEVMKICAFHSSVCVHCNSHIACNLLDIIRKFPLKLSGE